MEELLRNKTMLFQQNYFFIVSPVGIVHRHRSGSKGLSEPHFVLHKKDDLQAE